MTALANGHGFLSYLWHYLLARLIYDELLRPLTHGGTGAWVAFAVLALATAALLSRGRRAR